MILDTSVVVKWFIRERLHEQALGLRQGFLDGRLEIVCPDLLLLELANALKYAAKLPASAILGSIHQLVSMGVQVVPLAVGILERAVAIAERYDIAAYDAYFIALAEVTGQELVTADAALARKCKGHPLVVSLSDVRLESLH